MKKTALVILLLMLAALFCGCSDALTELEANTVTDTQLSSGYRRTTVFYLSSTGQIVPVVKFIPWEEGIGKAALNCLVANEDNTASASSMGLFPTVPDGVKFSLKIGEDAKASLDIENLPSLNSITDENNMIVSIVNTLAQFESIESVTITVDGKVVKSLPNGAELKSDMKAFALNVENTELSVDGGETHELTLYFPNKTGSLYIPVTRMVKAEPSFKLAISEYVKGPLDEALTNCLAQQVELKSAVIVDDVATITLSSAAQSLKDDETGNLKALCDALCLTASQYAPITQLKLYALDMLLYEEQLSATAPLYPNEFR